MKVAVLAALSVLSLFRQKLDSVSGKIMFRHLVTMMVAVRLLT
jgi:hypothetical protein